MTTTDAPTAAPAIHQQESGDDAPTSQPPSIPPGPGRERGRHAAESFLSLKHCFSYDTRYTMECFALANPEGMIQAMEDVFSHALELLEVTAQSHPNFDTVSRLACIMGQVAAAATAGQLDSLTRAICDWGMKAQPEECYIPTSWRQQEITVKVPRHQPE